MSQPRVTQSFSKWSCQKDKRTFNVKLQGIHLGQDEPRGRGVGDADEFRASLLQGDGGYAVGPIWVAGIAVVEARRTDIVPDGSLSAAIVFDTMWACA